MVSWTELLESLDRTPKPAVVGLHTSVQPRRDDGRGWPPASPVRMTVRFAYRPSGDWFFDYGHGDVSFTSADTSPEPEAGSGPGAEGYPAGLAFGPEFPWDLDPSPERLITCVHSPALAEATAVNSPEAVRHDGRDAWAVVLRTPSLHHPLRVTVDTTAGILLAAEVEAVGYREELTGLEFPAELPNSLFEWNEALAAAEKSQQERFEQAAAHYRELPRLLPAYWPGGLDDAEPSLIDADLTTGLLALDLGCNPEQGDGPSMAMLIRQPPNTPLYQPGWVSDPETYVHHWQDADWQWTLALQGRPLTREELERVIASLPRHN
ncbi:hypothetical protein ABT186_42040 [Streptomyces sp. NPDC001634]|uniref:hypothetical protein n=1 Tax=Streptomyces sp. NPDC001634 TaxID=3154390 RepID=UPI00331FA579